MERARDGSSSVRKKHLVGRGNTGTTSILDYIHLSSKLLRNVRHGQSLEVAINPRPTSHRSPLRIHSASNDDDNSASRTSSFASPQHAQAACRYIPLPKSTSVPILLETPQRRPSSATFLRFGRTVRFIADDGDLLLIDNDGSLKKAPTTFDADPRTLITVFPSDPLSVGATQKCVRVDEGVFLTQGAAAVYNSHNVVHGDANMLRDPMESGDRLGEATEQVEKLDNSGDRQAFQHGITVWSFSKLVDDSSFVPGRSLEVKAPLRSLDEEYFRLGTALELHQNGRVVCYEPKKSVTTGEPSASAPPISALASMAQGEVLPSAVSDKDKGSKVNSHLWLAKAPRSGSSVRGDEAAPIATRWRPVDVAIEKAHQHRQRLLAASKPKIDRRLMAPTGKRVGTADASAKSLHSRISTTNTQEMRQEDITELEERLDRAARIIVRFLRRICIDEAAKKRISSLAHRKRRELHRLTLSAIDGQDNQQSGLAEDEQLRILRCYKPSVYASHPLLMPPLNTTPQKAAAMRQMQRNRERSQEEKAVRISHELAFLRRTHVTTVLRARPATSN